MSYDYSLDPAIAATISLTLQAVPTHYEQIIVQHNCFNHATFVGRVLDLGSYDIFVSIANVLSQNGYGLKFMIRATIWICVDHSI